MRKEHLQSGPIDMLLLSLVARGPAHGYAIIVRLRETSRGAFDLPEGTVYPALYRLEAAGYLKSDAEQVSGRVRRNYHITRAGRSALKERESGWRDLVRGVDAVLRGPASERA